jgi:hypothetical protein
VIEDYFPIGSAPTEYCTIHGTAGVTIGGVPLAQDSTAGTMDPGVRPAALQEASPSARPAALRVLRVVRPDGTLHYVVKQR